MQIFVAFLNDLVHLGIAGGDLFLRLRFRLRLLFGLGLFLRLYGFRRHIILFALENFAADEKRRRTHHNKRDEVLPAVKRAVQRIQHAHDARQPIAAV